MSFCLFFSWLLSTKFGYKFFHLAQNIFEVRSAPGIAMVCYSNSFFSPPLEFQGQINSINTFQVPVLLSIQTSSLQNVIGGLKKTR